MLTQCFRGGSVVALVLAVCFPGLGVGAVSVAVVDHCVVTTAVD